MNGFLKGIDDRHIGNEIKARVTIGNESGMVKVKRNDNFDISLLAYTGETRNIFKEDQNWGTMKPLCTFLVTIVFTLCTYEKKEEFYFWMSRG